MRRGTSLPLDWHQPPLTLWDAEYADNECTNSHQPSKGMASKATSKDAGQKGMRTSDGTRMTIDLAWAPMNTQSTTVTMGTPKQRRLMGPGESIPMNPTAQRRWEQAEQPIDLVSSIAMDDHRYDEAYVWPNRGRGRC